MQEGSEFGARLKQARTRAGLTQVQAAEAIGIAQSTLAALEKKGTRTGFTVQLAALYGVSPSWLATGEGDILNTDDSSSVAHALSHRQPIMDIQEIEWERLSVTKLEGMFAMEIRGEALAPRFLPGQCAIWQAGDSAQDGQPVLIELDGAFFLRFYEGRGATWAGVADRTGHRELQPEQGAKIVARLRYLDLG